MRIALSLWIAPLLQGLAIAASAQEGAGSESPIALRSAHLTATFADNTAFGGHHRKR
ncbi:hypothetical protein BH23VER1_BH23VER1_19620 [soil metagenome]